MLMLIPWPGAPPVNYLVVTYSSIWTLIPYLYSSCSVEHLLSHRNVPAEVWLGWKETQNTLETLRQSRPLRAPCGVDYNRITHAADYYQPILDPGAGCWPCVWGWYRIDLNMFSCDNKTIIFSPQPPARHHCPGLGLSEQQVAALTSLMARCETAPEYIPNLGRLLPRHSP